MNKRIDKLEMALKVIRTWASFDEEKGCQIALIPEHVIKLCDKVLKPKQQTF